MLSDMGLNGLTEELCGLIASANRLMVLALHDDSLSTREFRANFVQGLFQYAVIYLWIFDLSGCRRRCRTAHSLLSAMLLLHVS